MNRPQNALDEYLRETGEKISAFAIRINRSPSTLTRALCGDREPSFDLCREVQAGTAGRVTAAQFLTDCLDASSAKERAETAA